MKKIVALISILSMILCFGTSFAEKPQKEISVLLNGEKLTFDASPFIKDGRTLIPARAIFEAFGAKLTWDDETKTVIITKTENEAIKSIILQINSKDVFVNEQKKELDVPACIKNDRTFVPLRFICEELNCDVDWNPDTYTVTVESK